jgi:hypothetical protein
LIKVLIVANVVSATKNDPCSDIVESVDESVNLISQIRRQLQVSISSIFYAQLFSYESSFKAKL